MAEMKIVLSKIERIESHENADRLEIAFTDNFDWPVIVGKDSFNVGDTVIHFPVDCVVNEKVEKLLLGNSKLKLSNGRIRAAKIRGVVSYGILSPIHVFEDALQTKLKFGVDYMKAFGCKKYEPPNKRSPQSNIRQASKKELNPYFYKYFNMNHLQNCKGIFQDDDIIIVTEKLHGTSARFGYLKIDLKWWQRPFKWFFSSHEFVYGSRNVQLQNRSDGSVYKDIVDKYNLKDVLSKYPDVSIYGEIVGPGIQKGYKYTDELSLFVYDIKMNGDYVDVDVVWEFCAKEKLPTVPLEFIGKYQDFKVKDYFKDASHIQAGGTECKTKEGVVISSNKEEITKYGRKKVKVINPEYLLNKNNSDYH